MSLLLHRAAKRQREAIKEGAEPLYLLEGVNFQDVQVSIYVSACGVIGALNRVVF